MAEDILIQIKNRLEHLLALTPLPMPDEINRELNIIYMVYQKNLLPQILDKHFRTVISLSRHVNDKFFTLSAINEGFSKNLQAYLLSTARDIFAVLSVMGAKEKKDNVENTFLEEGLALLASQGSELSLLGAADAHKRVEVDHLAYELSNDLWDSAAGNKKIKNITIEQSEILANQIDTVIENMKKSTNPFLTCMAIYNVLLYMYLVNLLRRIERVINKEVDL
jgi:hypothetical protein